MRYLIFVHALAASILVKEGETVKLESRLVVFGEDGTFRIRTGKARVLHEYKTLERLHKEMVKRRYVASIENYRYLPKSMHGKVALSYYKILK